MWLDSLARYAISAGVTPMIASDDLGLIAIISSKFRSMQNQDFDRFTH